MANNMMTKKNPDTAKKTGQAPRKKRRSTYRSYMILLISLMAVLVVVGGVFGYFAIQVYNHDGIYDGVTAGGVDLAGMSRREAASALDAQMQGVLDGMAFRVMVDEDAFEVTPQDLDISYSVDAVAAEAYSFGREGSFFARVGAILKAKMSGYTIDFTYTYNLDAFDKIAGEIADKVNVSESGTTYVIEDDMLVLTVGTAERHIDPLDISKAMLAKFENNTAGDIVLETGAGGRDNVDLEKIKKEVDREPVDAYLDKDTDPDNPVVVPEVNGLELDITVAAAILAKEGSGPNNNVYTIPLTVIEPEVKREDIKHYTYNDLLTTVKTTLNKNNVNRTSNIKLACDKIDGTILYPGDEFSFNKTVGERTYAAGFKDAAIYLAGEIADGVGGGICQVSSMLYMAAVGADLEISERRNHRYTVTYAELGEDATVAYDSNIDFKFVNNTDQAIMIKIVQESNYVLCEFYGTLTDETRNKTVTMEHTVTSYNEYGTKYQISEDVPVGQTSVKNGGYNGYTVKVYRVVKENGVEVSRTAENTSTYTKLDKVILINPEEAETLEDGTIVYVPKKDEPETPPEEPTDPDPGEPTDPEEPTDPDSGEPTDPEEPTDPDPGEPSEPDPDVPDDAPDWL